MEKDSYKYLVRIILDALFVTFLIAGRAVGFEKPNVHHRSGAATAPLQSGQASETTFAKPVQYR